MEDTERLQRRARWMRRWVWLSVLLAPVAALAIVVAVANLGPGDDEPNGTDAGWSPATAVAAARLTEWLEQPVAPLDDAVVLGHAGSRTSAEDAYGPAHVDGPAGVAVRVETFVVVGGGRLYEASLEVFDPPEGAPAVSSGPSLAPLGVAEPLTDAVGWVGASDVGTAVADPVAAAVDRWARALLSGDAEQLRLATGDGDASRTYLPLPATPVERARVVVAGTRPDGADRLVARVEITAEWQDPSEADDPDAFTGFQPVVYDILVERATTATPVVVAWGGPGTGMTLQPYGNAVPVGDVDTAPLTSTDPPTAGSTAGSTGTPTPSADTEEGS